MGYGTSQSNLQISDFDRAIAPVRDRLTDDQIEAMREAYHRNFGEHNDSLTRGGLAGSMLTGLDGGIKWLQEIVTLILGGTPFDKALKQANETASKFASVRTDGRAAVMFNVECREAGVSADLANQVAGCAPVTRGVAYIPENSDSAYDQILDARGLRGFDDGNNMSLNRNPEWRPERATVYRS